MATRNEEHANKLYGGNQTKVPPVRKNVPQQPKHPARSNVGSKATQAR